MSKIVSLSRRYEAHGVPFDTVEVREPRLNDILRLGEPFEAQQTGAGNVVIVDNPEAVAGYVRTCVVKPPFENLGELGVEDSRALRDAVLGFFTHGGSSGDKSPKTSETGQIS